MELVFEDTPPPPKEAPRPKIKPVPQVVHPRPLPTPAPPPIRHIATPTVEDSPVALPAPPPPPAQPIPQLDRTAEREAEFASKVKAAIQAAVVYPAAARNMGYRGKARVEFTLRDGVPHQAHIIQGSGIGMIDNAALAAVANARYPMTPESIKGKDIPYQVTVFFELNGNN